MKYLQQSLSFLFFLTLFTFSLCAQTADKKTTDFSDRQAVIETLDNFFIGDHTGSINHKKLSMQEGGAYRSVTRDGEYYDSIFNLESDDSDMSYNEELLSIDIYGSLALAQLRLADVKTGVPHYKVMLLQKIKGEWKITTISWGFGITQ